MGASIGVEFDDIFWVQQIVIRYCRGDGGDGHLLLVWYGVEHGAFGRGPVQRLLNYMKT